MRGLVKLAILGQSTRRMSFRLIDNLGVWT
jgi:hypothetical protein